MPLIRKDPPATRRRPATAATPPRLHGDARRALGGGARADGAGGDAALLAEVLGRESDPRVREAIFTSLARIGTPASVEAILPLSALGRRRPAHRRVGCAAGHAAARRCRAWPALLGDPDPDVRLLACDLARGLPAARATPLLCDLLETETEANVCAAAVDVLAEIGTPEALPALARCAERFGHEPFLAFAIRVAVERIRAQPRRPTC